MTHYKFLSESFLSKYRDLPDPFPSALSAFTYARTYSRFLPELHRRERWFETVARAVDFNLSLAPHDKNEAEALFHNVFNLRQNLSGRMTWLGGTDTANSNGCGLFNCAFDVVDSFDVFVEAFTLLMLGAGVGLRITKDDVSKLPIVRTGVDLVSKRYVPVYAPNRNEYTTLREHSINNVEIVVGDSRGAWTDALNIYFNLLWNVKFKKVTHITMNYDNIRGKGEPIKGFGGKSSGYQSMMDMFEAIHKVLQKGNTGVYKLKTIDALDIAGLIALNVVSGNVRRSSLMVLCNPDDSDVINAKENLYTQVNGKWVIDSTLLHRQMSNNTVMYHQKPSREQWKAHFEKLRFTGEPAFANMEQVIKRNPKALGLNPCGEILLDRKQMCNLSNVNMMAFVDGFGKYSFSQLRDAVTLATRVALRTTCVDLEFPEWDSQQKRDRLLGVGLSGVFDFMDATGISKNELASVLEALRDEIIESAEVYAKELGIPVPILSTTIKPSGTSSQLFGESSGAHRSHSQYFIRRVRVSANDPLVKVCEELGYKVLPEVGQTEQNCTTKVVEFYAESRAKRFKGDVSAIEQLQDYMFLQKHFTQHNTSITIHVKDDEWVDAEQFIFDNWDEFVAVSFISYDDSFYQLLPYESITEIEYIEGLEKLKPFNQGLLAKFESGEDFEIDGADCVSGMCPIK